MDNPKIQKALQNTGCVEANKLYKKILSVAYDSVELNQFFQDSDKAIIEEYMLFDDKGQKRYSFCIYTERGEEKRFYVYSKKSRRMVNLSQEEMRQIAGQVMNVKFRGRPSELKNNMISFANGDCITSTQAKKITINVFRRRTIIKLQGSFLCFYYQLLEKTTNI